MLDVEAKPSLDVPDDPLKWDGWDKYNADNPYERLCLDPKSKPDDEQIHRHCAALLQWWQKKLRLKNQPSNPMAQLLGRGIDDAARCLVEARMQLLDPVKRRQIDEQLAAQAEQEALADFSKYVAFSIARKVLTEEAEANLAEFGQRNGLTAEQTRACIEQELSRHKAKRLTPVGHASEAIPLQPTADAEKEFHRILRLSALDLADATWLVRRIFATIAENLGIHLERAEKLLDDYLDRDQYVPAPAAEPRVHAIVPNPVAPTVAAAAAQTVEVVAPRTTPAYYPAELINPIGGSMVLVPAGEFVMGSDADDAAPNEQPLTPVTLTEFYMARHPVTNAQYEQFARNHRQKRMKGAGDDHPVVYVTSLEAVRYCQWLGLKDGKTYRLPTEAEWEYAARGTDGRKYPWGNQERRGDFGNFADASTTFAWRDPLIHDGYPETSPVGAFPRGASFFGIHDMAGNVWEWCLDFYQPLQGTPKRNPRGLVAGTARLYRGGSWKSRFTNLRATARSSNAANFASNDVGFRIVCECAGGELNGKNESDGAA
jgi:formylglycine-generating enzyme required for sulfatase activity